MDATARLTSGVRRVAPYLILFVAAAATALVVVLEFWAFLGPVLGALIGGVLGVGHRLFGGSFEFTYQNRPLDWRLPAIGTSLFIVTMIAIYRPVYGFRPWSHYVVFGAMAGFLAYQIYVGQPRRQVIVQLVVFTFLTYWSTQFVFPVGAYAPDTAAFVPATNAILEANTVPTQSLYSSTPGHMIYVASTVEVSGLATDHLYLILSTLALVCAIVLTGYLDRVVESIDGRTALYAALFFGVMGFTLRRGFFPNKMNFFKPLIVIVILSVFALASSDRNTRAYAIVGIISVFGLVFGHTYSTGAAIMVIGVLWVFIRFVRVGGELDYDSSTPTRSATAFVFFAVVVFLGYSLVDTGSLINRLASLVLSTLSTTGQYAGSASSGTSGGRYSSLSLPLLLFSTAGQMMLFALSVAGVSAAFDFRDWSYDAILTWVAAGMGIIAFSVFVNAVDIPTPRIYSLLGMFGLNVVMVVGIALIIRTIKKHRASVTAVIVLTFAILSLTSPVAGLALSPIDDQVPHVRTYQTFSNTHANDWAERHISEEYYTAQRAKTRLPMKMESNSIATIDRAQISNEQLYVYTALAAETGVIFDSQAPALGGRQWVFLEILQASDSDDTIYSNGSEEVLIKN